VIYLIHPIKKTKAFIRKKITNRRTKKILTGRNKPFHVIEIEPGQYVDANPKGKRKVTEKQIKTKKLAGIKPSIGEKNQEVKFSKMLNLYQITTDRRTTKKKKQKK
jgi:hypothetical protein